MRISVARNFKGGLNTYDSQLGLSPQYLPVLDNLYPDTNGVLRVRFGTTRFADMSAHVTTAIGCTYFNGRVVVVDASGKIVTISGNGTVTLVWSTAIAALLPGSPAGWSTGLTFASFTQFNGELIICNGVDKPLLMTATHSVRYLQDLGTGSNVNTPRAKYCATYNNYLILAVTPTDKTTLYISNKGTSGTFVGDPAPNDAVNFNTGTYITDGPLQIKGLFTFRDRLMVMYGTATLACLLGEYSASPVHHIPRIDDTIESHGGVGHNAVAVLGDDALLMDTTGVSSLQRALITNSISPQRESTLVSADMQRALAPYSEVTLENQTFAVHDRLTQQVLFFLPRGAHTFNPVFTYCYDRSSRFKAWTVFSGMRYQCGCRSQEGRIFLVDGSMLYYYRNNNEPFFQDYAVATGTQPFSDGTTFTDGTLWASAAAYSGTAITYDMRTVMSDLRLPGSIKRSQYIELLVEGNSTYTVSMYQDRNTDAPALTAQFVNTADPSKVNALTYRPSNNMLLYAWPARFRFAQYRINGSTLTDFRIIGIKLHYTPGGHM